MRARLNTGMTRPKSFDNIAEQSLSGRVKGTAPRADNFSCKPMKHPIIAAFEAKEAHPGFKNVAKKIARKGGMSMHEASAVLAKRTREASASAKAHNPRLKRVK